MTACLKRSRLLTTASMVLAVAALAGCDGGTVKDTLGINREAPDEYRVVSRPPLTVPPQFSLLPPNVEARAPNQLPTSERAREMVLHGEADAEPSAGADPEDTADMPVAFGSSGNDSSVAGKTTADTQFLKNIGADQADPNIRKELIEERIAKQIEQEDESWWDVLSTEPEPKDSLVNASKESERIQENEDTGKPVNEGETPVVKAKDTGILGRIMGN